MLSELRRIGVYLYDDVLGLGLGSTLASERDVISGVE